MFVSYLIKIFFVIGIQDNTTATGSHPTAPMYIQLHPFPSSKKFSPEIFHHGEQRDYNTSFTIFLQ